jgi:dihydrofolate reductase
MHMRKIIVSQFITLDGVMEGPEKWNTKYLSDVEVVNEILSDFDAGDAILFGRSSYEFFSARWPSRSGAMADKFNLLTKYVVSTSLQKTEWSNSVTIKENVIESIKALKMHEGKNIILFGSYQLLQTLMCERLVDEYKVYVYPLTLGTGKRLFEQGAAGQTFKTIDVKSFASGVIAMTYQPESRI